MGCEWCGEAFPVLDAKGRARRFCSRGCRTRGVFAERRRSAEASRPVVLCACGCGTPLTGRKRAERDAPRFVVGHNLRLITAPKPERACEVCGEVFRRTYGRFCSKACSGVSRRRPRPDRSGAEYREWRMRVMERDRFACRGCGAKGHLHVHHIHEFAQFVELRLEVENGLTLCPACHSYVHGRALAKGVDLSARKADPWLLALAGRPSTASSAHK